MIKTPAELDAKKAEAIAKMTKCENGKDIIRVVVGLATCGNAAGAIPVFNALDAAVKEMGLENVAVCRAGCIGMCQFEPIVEVTVPGQAKVTYVKMNEEKAKAVASEHLKNGNPVAEYTVGAIA